MIDHAITEHEGAHAAGMIAACSMIPAEVRADRPDLHVAGRTTADFTHHTADFGLLIATLMGPLSEGEVIRWPPSKDSVGDERNAALLVEHLKLGKQEYRFALALAAHLLDDPDVKAAHALIAQALSRVPVLNGRQLRELLGPRTLERFDIEGVTPE